MVAFKRGETPRARVALAHRHPASFRMPRVNPTENRHTSPASTQTTLLRRRSERVRLIRHPTFRRRRRITSASCTSATWRR